MDPRTPPHVRLKLLLRTLPLKRGADKVHRLLEISDLWGIQRDYDEAHASAAAAYDLAIEIDSDNLKARALSAQAKAHRFRDRDEEAMMDDATAADIYSALAEWEAEVEARIDVANSACNLEMYCEARDQATKALAIAEGISNEILVGRCALILARALCALEEYEATLEYANRGRTLLAGEAWSQSLACDLIAEAHLALGAPEQALHYLEQSLVIMQAIDHRQSQVGERLRFADGLRKAGRQARAHEVLTETIAIVSENNSQNIGVLGKCHLELALVLHDLGETESAHQALHTAALLLEVADRPGDLEECQRVQEQWKVD